MALKKGQILDLEIAGLVFGGRGLAHVDGLTVFVEGGLPGDRVKARIQRKKRRYAEARALEVVDASPHRRAAPCRYSDFCGGCTWQSLAYETQLHYKRRHVAEALAHIGGLGSVTVYPTMPSERVFAYRNKMEFTCSDRRWLLPAELGREGVGGDFGLGLHVPGTFYKVLDIESCLLQPALGDAILDDVRAYIRTSGMPVYGLRSHTGFWRFVMLRHAVAGDRWMVNIVTRASMPRAVQPLADALLQRYPQIVSVVNNVTASKAGVAVGESEALLGGAPVIVETVGGLDFEISANSFFQTNTRGAEKLYRVVKAYAQLSGSETVIDLYCGTGTIALLLAGAAGEVVGIEQVPAAVENARRNARINSISNCRFAAGDAAQVLTGLDVRPQVMVIDPPRAGLHPKVIRRALALSPARIVYVSCNPATLARDLALLAENYAPKAVQPVDLFPHTHHIEAVVQLEKKGP